ncbi:MAG: exodeoxyribonuclease V subunit gamma [Chloroflexota bacterium]|nr:exodeoxyribonuclease V subunit gamma [Chloroflexota bacterium]
MRAIIKPQIYLDPYGPPARERLAGLVAEAKASDVLVPVTVVVPAQYSGLSLRRAVAGGGGLLNVRFMVVARVAEYLGAPGIAAQGKQPLSPLVELAAIRFIAGEMAGRGLLGGVARHSSLHLSLRGTFQDLARLAEPELNRLAQTDSLRAQTIEWYRRFRERTRPYYHREEIAAAAAEAIRSGVAETTLRDLGAVIFFLVQELSPAEEAMARALGESGCGAMILGLTGESEVDQAVQHASTRLSTAFALAPAGARSPRETEVDGILIASDVREEVRWVVRRMMRLAREGVPFHRMAALYRQVDPYASQLRMELSLAGIPMAGPDPTLLKNTPAGRLLLGLLDIVQGDFSRSTVMQWIAEAPVGSGRGKSLASAELPRWEEVSRKAGVLQGIDQWRDRVGLYKAQLADKAESIARLEETSPSRVRGLEDMAERADRLIAFVEGLAERKPPPDGSRWREFGKWAMGLVEDYAHEPAQWPAGHQASHERLLDVLDEMAELDSVDPGTTLAVFRQALEEALEAPAGRTGATGSGVFVASLGAALGMGFEAVWVLGMADGAFPPRAAEDPLLPDALRRQVGDGKLPLRRASMLEERRLFLAALAGGKRRYLSYARTDSAAQRGQHPSPWLLDAASALNGGRRVFSQDLPRLKVSWLSLIESPEHALEDTVAGGAADEHGFDLGSIASWRRAGGRLEHHPLAAGESSLARALRVEQARRETGLTPWDGYVASIAGTSARLAQTLTAVISPTRLERWAECPFRFFLGDVLSIAALETPEELIAISALDRGKVIHSILERFIKEADPPALGASWEPRHHGLLLSIAEGEFQKAEDSGVTGRRLLWEAVKADIRQDLETFLEKDAEWRAERAMRPLHVEWEFGIKNDPVTLSLPDGSRVNFRGLIDRVDADEKKARALVIDYKTGGSFPYNDMKDDPLGQGTHLQLPVYALAARTALIPEAAVEAEYWFISSRGKFERKTVPLAEVEGAFKTTVQAIVAGIRGGVFPANPGPPGLDGPANCSFCDFTRLCPANRKALWERKQASTEAALYMSLVQPHSGDTQGDA